MSDGKEEKVVVLGSVCVAVLLTIFMVWLPISTFVIIPLILYAVITLAFGVNQTKGGKK
jgi:hypothetical protein